jgi:2-deoxy-D-gluconate 3-dehydrogenase
MTATEQFDLRGSSAIVTGGAMGIGFGIAAALQAAGANVLIADIDGDAAAQAAGTLGANTGGGATASIVVDIRDVEAGPSMVGTCTDRFGSLDILVNNAGIYPVAELDALTPEIFDAVFDLNVRGALFATKAVAAALRAEGRPGSIINLASMSAFRPNVTGLAHYGASKGAVVTMTKHLAVALAPDRIRVNAIVPGGIVTHGSKGLSEGTDMTDDERDALIARIAARVPMGRLGVPADFGGPAVFLASKASAYVTGAVLAVDGGLILAS